MQTFLPAYTYAECARILDYRRLGKQRVECKQILLALTSESYGWKNHPATKMWEGYELGLIYYMDCMCQEWKNRGYSDFTRFWLKEFHTKFLQTEQGKKSKFMPWWRKDSALLDSIIRSHRSNLLRKDPGFYGKFGWSVPPDLEYVWATQTQKEIA